jgi:hypothetical protein
MRGVIALARNASVGRPPSGPSTCDAARSASGALELDGSVSERVARLVWLTQLSQLATVVADRAGAPNEVPSLVRYGAGVAGALLVLGLGLFFKRRGAAAAH